MEHLEWYHYLIAIGGGALAGVLNTLAGSGSAITLSILTEVMGLPGNMANGTNRVGVFAQTLASTIKFHNKGRLNLEHSRGYIFWTVVGAIIGIGLAVWVSNEQFRLVFSYLMILMLFIILVNPKRWLIETDHSRPMPSWLAIPAFLALGIYGGFIQMGMGVFFLAVMVLGARYSIIDSNAVKAAVVALYTIIALAIFQWKGLIDWRIGGIIAIGQTAGGWYTAAYASESDNAKKWAYRLLVLVVLMAIVKLFGLGDWVLEVMRTD
ncbi:MAG: sulfite exporter TauE/SafE family protein [Bacteroidota bacterium]